MIMKQKMENCIFKKSWKGVPLQKNPKIIFLIYYDFFVS